MAGPVGRKCPASQNRQMLGHANEEMSLLFRWHGLTVINDCYDKQTSANQDESGESDSLKITGVGKY